MTITHQIEKIGPEKAQEYIDTTSRNRPTNAKKVEELTRYMRDGLWRFDGAPVRFDRDGHMIDGKHRMTAVVESGVESEFFVVRGLDPDSIFTIDTGRKRSLADHMSMMGEQNATVLSALLLVAVAWSRGSRGISAFSASTNNGNRAVSIEEAHNFFLEDQDSLREAAIIGQRIATKLRIPTRPVSVCSWMFGKIDKDDSEYFFDRLFDGAGLEEGSPILALRSKLIAVRDEAKKSRSWTSPTYVTALIIKAWNAYRRGVPVQVLGWRAGGANPETFPEPK